MGSPLSPIVAEIFMDEVETRILEKSTRKSKNWLSYVADILIVWERGKEELNNFLKQANKEYKKVKFTLEIENNFSIPFLDKMLICEKKQKHG